MELYSNLEKCETGLQEAFLENILHLENSTLEGDFSGFSLLHHKDQNVLKCSI